MSNTNEFVNFLAEGPGDILTQGCTVRIRKEGEKWEVGCMTHGQLGVFDEEKLAYKELGFHMGFQCGVRDEFRLRKNV